MIEQTAWIVAKIYNIAFELGTDLLLELLEGVL